MTRATRVAILLPLLLFPGACAASASKAPETTPAAPTPRTWEGGREVASSNGAWRIVYKIANGEIRRGEAFSIDAWVFAAGAPEEPRKDVSLAVDAAMPQHGHGMNRVPHIEEPEPGRFRIDGLFFHMPGKWQLYFDVGSGPLVERAQTDVEVE